jgi:hypothetical protein
MFGLNRLGRSWEETCSLSREDCHGCDRSVVSEKPAGILGECELRPFDLPFARSPSELRHKFEQL